MKNKSLSTLLLFSGISFVLSFSVEAKTSMCVISNEGDTIKYDIEEVREVVYEIVEDKPEVEIPVVDESETPLKFKILTDSTVELKNNDSYVELDAVKIPNKVRIKGKVFSVTSIGYLAFGYCESLKSVEIPKSVTKIGGYAFWGCESLKSIELPNSVKSIEEKAFYGCHGLESLEIPNGVESIGNLAFKNCESLESVEIPESVKTIGEEAFHGCSKAEIVIFNKESEVAVGLNAFDGCKSVTFKK